MMINTWSSHSLAVFFCICTASLFPQRVYFPFPEGHFPFLSKLMSLSTKRSKQTMPFLFSALISLHIIDMFSCFTFGSGWHSMLFLYTQGVLNPLLAHSCVFIVQQLVCFEGFGICELEEIRQPYPNKPHHVYLYICAMMMMFTSVLGQQLIIKRLADEGSN